MARSRAIPRANSTYCLNDGIVAPGRVGSAPAPELMILLTRDPRSFRVMRFYSPLHNVFELIPTKTRYLTQFTHLFTKSSLPLFPKRMKLADKGVISPFTTPLTEASPSGADQSGVQTLDSVQSNVLGIW